MPKPNKWWNGSKKAKKLSKTTLSQMKKIFDQCSRNPSSPDLTILVPMPKNMSLILRLLLRSVYLKGRQDGNQKTTDISWEDKIVSDIKELLLGILPKEKGKWTGGFNEAKTTWKRKGYNRALADVKKSIEEIFR